MEKKHEKKNKKHKKENKEKAKENEKERERAILKSELDDLNKRREKVRNMFTANEVFKPLDNAKSDIQSMFSSYLNDPDSILNSNDGSLEQTLNDINGRVISKFENGYDESKKNFNALTSKVDREFSGLGSGKLIEKSLPSIPSGTEIYNKSIKSFSILHPVLYLPVLCPYQEVYFLSHPLLQNLYFSSH